MTAAITVGMPVRNGAEYLEEAIRSLLVQTEGDFILHISDNCSDDATPEICARLAAEDPRIRYVRQQRNLGAAGNFHYLLQEARSPFFKWAAHDDFMEPEFLASSMQRLRQAPDAVACSVGVRMIDETGGELQCVLPSPGLASSRPVDRARAALTTYQWNGVIYGLMRRQALRAETHVNDNIHGADVAFVFGMVLEGRIVTTDEILLTYRVLDIAGKKVGEEPHLYDQTRTPQMYRAMVGDIARTSLPPGEKARLRLLVLRRWVTSERRARARHNLRGIHRAVEARRHGILALRLPAQVLLTPRLVVQSLIRALSDLGSR